MKVQEYDLKRLGQQMVDFHDDLRDLISFGKYSFPIVAAVPAWTADNGEMAFYDGGTSSTLPGKRIYVRLSSSWEVFATAGNGVPAPPEGAVQFNSANFFGGNSNLIWDNSSKNLIISSASNTRWTGLILANTIGAVAGQNSAACAISFGFGSTTNNALLTVQKANDYVNAGASDSNMIFFVETDGSLVEFMRIGAAAGGGGGIGIFRTNPTVALSVNGEVIVGASNTDPPVNGIGVQNGVAIGTTTTDPYDNSSQLHIVEPTTTIDSTFQSNAQVNFNFKDRGGTLRMIIAAGMSGTAPDSNSLELVHRNATTGGHVAIYNLDAGSPAGIANEDPVLVVGGSDGPGGQGGFYLNQQVLTIRSNLTIGRQRFTTFGAQSARLVANAVSGTTIGALATVYIEGPTLLPTTAASGSGIIVTTGNYALWIAKGPVRVDGDLITGGATTQTKGNVFFTSTAIGVSSNNTTDTTLIRGIIGTTSLVANTLSEGRTIRLQARGFYNTAASAPSLQWRVKLGGTTVLTTGSLQTVASVSTGMFDLTGLITCWTTGGAGTVYAQGGVTMGTGATDGRFWGMVNSGTVVINTTGANVLELTVQWGSGAPQNEVALTHCVGELLN